MKNIVIILFLLVGILPCTAQELVWEIFPENTTGLGRIEFLPDGERFINNGNGQIQVRSLEDGRLLDSIVDPEGATYIIGFSDDETRLITFTDDVGYKIYDSHTFNFIKKIEFPKSIFEKTQGFRGGEIIDYHYNSQNEIIYILQSFGGWWEDVKTRWMHYYGRRLIVLDLKTDNMIFEKVFETEIKFVPYPESIYNDITKLAVNKDGTVIVNESGSYPGQKFGLHIFKQNFTRYSYVEEPNIKGGATTAFFEVFDNGKKLLRVFDKAFSHPTLGDINYLVYDIESEKLVDGYIGSTIFDLGASFDGDSILIVHQSYLTVINVKDKVTRYNAVNPIKRPVSFMKYNNHKVLFTSNYNKSSIFLYNYDWETLSSIESNGFEENNIYINPTPTSGVFNIQINKSFQSNLIIDLYNITGTKLVNIFDDIILTSNFSKEVDISSYPNGSYYLKIENNGRIYTKTIIKGE